MGTSTGTAEPAAKLAWLSASAKWPAALQTASFTSGELLRAISTTALTAFLVNPASSSLLRQAYWSATFGLRMNELGSLALRRIQIFMGGSDAQHLARESSPWNSLRASGSAEVRSEMLRAKSLGISRG